MTHTNEMKARENGTQCQKGLKTVKQNGFGKGKMGTTLFILSLVNDIKIYVLCSSM